MQNGGIMKEKTDLDVICDSWETENEIKQMEMFKKVMNTVNYVM